MDDPAGEIDGAAELFDELVDTSVDRNIAEVPHADQDPQNGATIFDRHCGEWC